MSLGVLIDDVPMLPKLFRRISDFMKSRGTAVGFRAAIEMSREPVLDLATSNFTHFDTFIEQGAASTRIRLTRNPEGLVFDAMPTRAVDHCDALTADGASARRCGHPAGAA